MKKLSELKDFHGIDVSNEISLFEYGLLCQIKEDTKEIQCWYGIEFNGDENAFIIFDHVVLNLEQIDNIINENWFDKKAFFSFVGFPEKNWLNDSYVVRLQNLIGYYGTKTIFGSTYDVPIEIKND